MHVGCCGGAQPRSRSRPAKAIPRWQGDTRRACEPLMNRWTGLVGPARTTSNDAFPADGAAIHLEFELSHRRPRVVPGQPGARRAAAHDLVGEERIEVAHGVDLRRRGVRPAETEPRQPALHLAENVAPLLAHGLGTTFAAPDGAFAVASAPFPRLGAARDHEARRGIGVGNGEREGWL